MSTGPEQINRELNHSLDCATKLYNSIVDFHPALVEEADAILHDDDTPLVTLVRLGGLLPYTPREADIATRRSNPEPKFYIAIEHSRISRAARRMGLAAVSAVFNTTDRLDNLMILWPSKARPIVPARGWAPALWLRPVSVWRSTWARDMSLTRWVCIYWVLVLGLCTWPMSIYVRHNKLALLTCEC